MQEVRREYGDLMEGRSFSGGAVRLSGTIYWVDFQRRG